MVHGGQRAAVRVRHDFEDVEVVTQFVGRDQHQSARVELHGAHRLVGVRGKVGDKLVAVRVLAHQHLATVHNHDVTLYRLCMCAL